MNGEKLNDTIYTANKEVEERFDVLLTPVVIENIMDTEILRNSIMSGNDDYDLSYMHNTRVAAFALEGMFLNVATLPYVDITAEWWPQQTVDAMNIAGQMYFFSNYISYQASAKTYAAFFNQNIITNNELENPYDLVRSGAWTLDKMAEMTSSVYVDTNGDGTRDTEDTVGLAFFGVPYYWAECCDIEAYRVESTDPVKFTLDINNERVINTVDKLHNWFFGGNQGAWVDFGKNTADSLKMFTSGNAMFTFDRVGPFLPQILETDIHYGIVPFPKVDEQQENYIAGCGDILFSVPITAPDPERTGIMIEAMTYAGYKNVIPAYIDTTLQHRYATDEDCAEMLRLIIANQRLSYAYLFVTAVPDGMQLHLLMNTVPNNNFASWYATKESAELAFLDKLEDFYNTEHTAEGIE